MDKLIRHPPKGVVVLTAVRRTIEAELRVGRGVEDCHCRIVGSEAKIDDEDGAAGSAHDRHLDVMMMSNTSQARPNRTTVLAMLRRSPPHPASVKPAKQRGSTWMSALAE